MHGTGTPLGDPIELGAATAVLRKSSLGPAGYPLRLAADKSWLGHTEPAAGLLGLCWAQASLQAAASNPICHLSQVSVLLEYHPPSPPPLHTHTHTHTHTPRKQSVRCTLPCVVQLIMQKAGHRRCSVVQV